MDEFEVFFTFYGLLLGLAAAEILGSLGGLVREGSLRSMRPPAALLASLTFLLICATWIDAWSTRTSFTLDLRSLWAPIGAATSYYLAAVVVLPRKAAAWDDVDAYFAERKAFVIAALAAAEVFVTVTHLPAMEHQLRTEPMVFWLYIVPFNVAIMGTFAVMYLVKSRRANIIAITAQLAIFATSYWSHRWISNLLRETYGYPGT
jgi:hypothetical protein